MSAQRVADSDLAARGSVNEAPKKDATSRMHEQVKFVTWPDTVIIVCQLHCRTAAIN